MLAQLGPLQFTVAPLNFNQSSHEVGSDFAEHPVIGARPTLEYVGPSPERRTVQGKLFPDHYGGLGDLEALKAISRAGVPQPFVRGDGTPHGWFVVEKVRETATYIGPNGIGRVIEIEVDLKRAGPPSDLFDTMQGLFP